MRSFWMRRLLIAAAAFPLLTLAACNSENTKDGKVSTEEAISVQTFQVQATNSVRTIHAVGTIRHRRETPLGFTTSGKVSYLRYDVGDYVKRGALIGALDSTNVTADLNVANAERNRAQSEFSRIASLYKDGWVTKGQYCEWHFAAICTLQRCCIGAVCSARTGGCSGHCGIDIGAG
jgi:multidrug efflux pump subunit AcrA (membrane-fusion protein)